MKEKESLFSIDKIIAVVIIIGVLILACIFAHNIAKEDPKSRGEVIHSPSLPDYT